VAAGAILVIIISSEVEQPALLVIVHRNVALPDDPETNLKVEVGELAVVMVNPVPPDTIVHAPVSPDPGALADNVPATVAGHTEVMSGPALAVVTLLTVIFTSSKTNDPSAQVLDNLNLYVFPPIIPVTVVVRAFGLVITAAGPLTCDHVVTCGC